MLADHIGLALLPGVPVLRVIGRMSFVLYCFLLTEGFLHTRSRRAYLLRLLVLAVVSEVPYDLFLFAQPFYPLEQNVFFTLALSLCALHVVERGAQDQPLRSVAVLIGLCLASMVLRVSYAWLGIMLCVCFYAYRESPLRRAAGVAAMELLYAASLLCGGEALSWALTQLLALFSLFPIACYNGKRGTRALRLFFYAAYPLSLLAIYAIRTARVLPPYWGV